MYNLFEEHMIIIYLLISFIFFGLAIWMLTLFFKFKKRKDEFYAKGENYSPWSFKGFWYRNKYQIPLFGVFMFGLLSLAFLVILI